MYNEEFKHTFIEDKNYANTTKERVLIFFSMIENIEKELKKDLYDFNEEELTNTLILLKAPTVRGMQSYLSVMRQYLNYAISKKKSIHKKNLINLFREREKIVPLLTEEKMIFTKEEIEEMIKKSENMQDGVILALLFEGVNYKNEYEELIHLTIHQIDKEKKEIKLKNRSLKISEKTLHFIQKAFEETTYKSTKGNIERKYELSNSPYVLKGLRKKIQLNHQLVHQRMLRLSNYFGHPELKATNISYSGQIDYAGTLFQQGKNIDDAIHLIIERFDMADNVSSRYSLKERILKYAKK
jgi:hypothetical protein